MKDLWRWEENKIKINTTLNNFAVIKIWGVLWNVTKKECETSGLTEPDETLKLYTTQYSQGMAHQKQSKNKLITQIYWVLSKHFRLAVYCNPTTCLHILCRKRDIYQIMVQDFLFFLIAVCPVLLVTMSQLLLLCNNLKSVTTNTVHQWWQQMVNHSCQISAVLVISRSSLITKLHTM
jgi:hypothetical protein